MQEAAHTLLALNSMERQAHIPLSFQVEFRVSLLMLLVEVAHQIEFQPVVVEVVLVDRKHLL